jgi:hypothetical protein
MVQPFARALRSSVYLNLRFAPGEYCRAVHCRRSGSLVQGISKVERAFRSMKSDDLARPIHRRLEDRVRDRPAVAFSPGRAAVRRPAHPTRADAQCSTGRRSPRRRFCTKAESATDIVPRQVCYGGTAAGAGCRRGKPRARRRRLEAGSGCIRRRDGRPLAIVLTCVAGNASNLRTVVRHVRPKP